MASAADPLGQSAMRYSRVAMWFHWMIAALVGINLLLGFFTTISAARSRRG